MKIIVLGAGKVGKTLIKHMSNEDHDIIVVDQNATKVEEVVNQYDVIGVVGNGGSYDILMEAGAEDANLIICVTTSDELNILAGLMAKKMGTRHTIARVRNPDYSSQRDFMRNQLGFSMIVNPELEAASEIRRVLSFPSAVKVDTFSRGKVELAEFFVEDQSRLKGIELNQLHKITSAFSAVATCLNNVGPGMNVVGPVGNFSSLSDVSKLVLSFDMLAGRLEIFPMLLLFAPSQWRK